MKIANHHHMLVSQCSFAILCTLYLFFLLKKRVMVNMWKNWDVYTLILLLSLFILEMEEGRVGEKH